MYQLLWRSLPLPGCRRTRISGVTGNLCTSQNIAPLLLSLVFSLSHKLLFGLGQNPSQTYFLLQSALPAGDTLGFQAELRGWRHLGLCWMCCIFPESITKGDSVAVFVQPRALLHSSWPSPWLQPTAHRGRWVYGLVCIGVCEPTPAHFYFPRLPAEVFLFHGRLVLCVLLWHRPSQFSSVH